MTKVPGRITLQWSNPGASDLAGVVVRRSWATCPTSKSDGVQIGGTAVRTRQIDTGAADNSRYCYAIFAFDSSGNYSHATVARGVMNPGDQTAPRPVTDLTASPAPGGHVKLSWRNPLHAGIAFVAVRRGLAGNCPTGPADGSAVGGQAVRTSQVDTNVEPGIAYCYRVFALDAAGNISAGNSDTDATAPKQPVQHRPAPVSAPAASSSGSWLTSTLMHMVAVVGLLMLLVMAAATAVTRRRTHTSAYIPAREGGPRLAMTGVAPAALVIPALLVMGCGAAIVLVLLNL